MRRRDFVRHALGVALLPALPRLAAAAPQPGVAPLRKPHAEWRRLLTAAQYDVLFDEDTERPGSSPLNAEKRAGTYVCAACFLPLFASADKFESGTGGRASRAPSPGASPRSATSS
jgi:peptide-methionine (R)-S-oxide reductase